MPRTLSVLTYNVYMRPFPLFINGQKRRAELLPEQVRDQYDLIIFEEAFDDGVRKTLLQGLLGVYPYQTRILGRDGRVDQDGGVIMVSRWPFVAENQRAFGDVCDGSDCKANKGVLYASIVKKGLRHHFFGSHTNAGSGADGAKVNVRGQQFGIIKTFIDSLNIPASEPVVIGGDLNVDKIAFGSEYQAMLQMLNATHPGQIGESLYSIDPTTNKLTDQNGSQELLDYVLFSNAHLQPVNSSNEVRALKSSQRWRETLLNDWKYDLSDHYPVHGRFEFAPAPVAAAPVNYRSTIRLEHVTTEYALHSHLLNYGHPNSSGQQQVTCFGGADDNDWWVIKGMDGQPEDFQAGAPVQDGDTVRLQHLLTKRNLHSHEFLSPVTGQQEVTCFGDDGLGDGNDNWRVAVEGGGAWDTSKQLRLIHVATNFALHSHRGWSHPQWTDGQQEVTGFEGRDGNDLWTASLR